MDKNGLFTWMEKAANNYVKDSKIIGDINPSIISPITLVKGGKDKKITLTLIPPFSEASLMKAQVESFKEGKPVSVGRMLEKGPIENIPYIHFYLEDEFYTLSIWFGIVPKPSTKDGVDYGIVLGFCDERAYQHQMAVDGKGSIYVEHLSTDDVNKLNSDHFMTLMKLQYIYGFSIFGNTKFGLNYNTNMTGHWKRSKCKHEKCDKDHVHFMTRVNGISAGIITADEKRSVRTGCYLRDEPYLKKMYDEMGNDLVVLTHMPHASFNKASMVPTDEYTHHAMISQYSLMVGKGTFFRMFSRDAIAAMRRAFTRTNTGIEQHPITDDYIEKMDELYPPMLAKDANYTQTA